MKRLFMMLLLASAGSVFGAASSSSKSEVSVISSHSKMSLKTLCCLSIIIDNKITDPSKVEQSEELQLLPPFFRRQISQAVAALNRECRLSANMAKTSECCKRLKRALKMGADPNLVVDENENRVIHKLISHSIYPTPSHEIFYFSSLRQGKLLFRILCILSDRGADFNVFNGGRQTPLGLICSAWVNDRGEVQLRKINLARWLIVLGADPNKKFDDPEVRLINTTPLICAIRARQPGLVELLLQKGADPNLQDNHGETALHEVAVEAIDRDDYFSQRILKALFSSGANPCIKDADGRTAFEVAKERERCVGGRVIVSQLIREKELEMDSYAQLAKKYGHPADHFLPLELVDLSMKPYEWLGIADAECSLQ